MKITITKEVSPQELSDLIASALEGGMASWVHEVENTSHPAFKGEDGVVFYGDPTYFELPDYRITIRYDREEDEEGAGEGVKVLREEDFVLGLETLAKVNWSLFAELMNDDADGVSADAFLQCAVLGKIVYG